MFRSLAVVPVCLLAAALVRPDFPPVAHTGGFGEPTCAECHGGSPVNGPGTSLTLGGLPARWRRGAVYRVAVELRRDSLARAGFELAVRFAGTGLQAGRLTPSDTLLTTVTADTATGVQYAHHTREGTRAEPVGRWTVVWRAPRTGHGEIVFHAAGVAANDDDSNLGDFVATTAVAVRSPR